MTKITTQDTDHAKEINAKIDHYINNLSKIKNDEFETVEKKIKKLCKRAKGLGIDKKVVKRKENSLKSRSVKEAVKRLKATFKKWQKIIDVNYGEVNTGELACFANMSTLIGIAKDGGYDISTRHKNKNDLNEQHILAILNLVGNDRDIKERDYNKTNYGKPAYI